MNEENQPVSFDYSKEKLAYDGLISDWSAEVTRFKERRKFRENKRNVEEERAKGTILEDETIIPDRTIDTNIRRGKVNYIAYITQSKRLLILTSPLEPAIPTEPLETWFTHGMRYPKWEMPWFRAIDSFHVHGGCGMEVINDPEKPLGCAIEYIPRDSLIFPKNTKDIQACPRILRRYDVTSIQLEEFRDTYGFDQNVVKSLLERHQRTEDFISIYKVLCKRAGVVYNAWYASGSEANDWLRPPVVHEVGLFDFTNEMIATPVMEPDGSYVPMFMSSSWSLLKTEYAKPLALKAYPVFWFRYQETENENLLETPNRVGLDLHVQEALTHLITNTVNASTRASGIYASAEDEPGGDPSLRELGSLKSGRVMSRGLNFFQPPWPNNIALAIAQMLDMRKSNEAGHTDFASMARKDANKTATEMNLAVEQAQSMTTTDMSVFAASFLDVYALCFKIASHQAVFELVVPPKCPKELLLQDWNMRPAGDIEVIKRLEDMQNAKEFFMIVQGTPAAEKILTFLIQRFFPDQADEWIAAIAGPNKDAIIAQLINILQQIPQDELTPDQRAALANVINTASSVVAAPGDNAPVGPPQAGPANAAQPSNAPA